jgi:hypothetical protein
MLPATALIRQRNRRSQHETEFSSGTRFPADPGGAAELADVCGDLPLALRIAAALLAEDPVLSPHQLGDQLRDAEPLHGLVYGQAGVVRRSACRNRPSPA